MNRMGMVRLMAGMIAVAALTPDSVDAQSLPDPSLVVRSNYTIFSGDVNGDGHVDILAKSKPKIVFISLDDLGVPVMIRTPMPTFVILSSSNGTYSLSANPSASTVGSGIWVAGTHDLRFGDILGNGAGGAVIEARSPGNPSFSISATPSGQPQLLQTLNAASLGFDLGAAGTTTELSDRNGDGRNDLTIFVQGLVASVLLANSDGIFVANQESTIRATWMGFTSFLQAGNMNSALAYIAAGSAPIYTELMQRLGPNLSHVVANLTDIKAVRLSSDYATFAVFDQSNGQRTLHFLVFTREDGRWVLEAL